MRLLRSWPEQIPEGRSYVTDSTDLLIIKNCDYSPLRGYAGESILMLEWDIAVAQEDLRTFAQHAAAFPDQVTVAPYRIYADSYGLPADTWAHRHWHGEPKGMHNPTGVTPLRTGDTHCQLFGLGMVYLPAVVLAGWFAAGYSTHFGDVEFSTWHYREVSRTVPVDWSVRPVHLNYLTETVAKEIG